MANEENELLLKVLCAMLPYGVKIKYHYKRENNVIDEVRELDFSDVETLKYNNEYPQDYWCEISWKPYLRPMTSMTDEEKAQVQMFMDIVTGENYGDGYSPSAWDAMNGFAQYCDSRHLDHRGLIFKGLALESPEGMYSTKDE